MILLEESRLRRIATWGVLLLLVLTASVYAAVEPGSRAWFLWGALAILTLVSWSARRDELTGPLVAVAMTVAGVIAWGLLQVVPLPAPILRAVDPKTAAFYRVGVPEGGGRSLPAFLVQRAVAEGAHLAPGAVVPDGPPDRGGWGVGSTISIAPQDTRRACLSWLAPGLLALAVALLARDALRRSILLWGISLWGGVLGAFALFQSISGTNLFLGSRAAPEDSDPIGPFINDNHFATYLAVSALIAIGLALAHLGRPSERFTAASLRRAALDTGFALPRLLTASCAALFSVVGLALSGSRGGWLAFGIGGAILVVGARRSRWGVGVLGAVIIAGIAVGVASWLAVGGDAGMAPFVSQQRDASAAERVDGWARTLQVAMDHPVVGTGLGTFPWAFGRYQRRGESAIWRQAHNDYLQILAENGAVGALLLLGGMFVGGRRVVGPALRGDADGPRWTTLAGVAAMTAIAVHAIVDFSLQIPADAALAAVVVGIVTAAASDAKA